MNKLTKYIAGSKIYLGTWKKNQIFGALKWQYYANIGIGVLGATYILAVGAALGIEQFGIYSLSVSLSVVIFTILDFRLQETVIYLDSHLTEGGDKNRSKSIAAIFWLEIITRFCAFSLSIAAGSILATYLGLEQALHLVILSSIVTLTTKIGNSSSLGLLRLSGDFEFFSKCQVSDWAFRLLFLMPLYFFGRMQVDYILASQIAPAFVHNFLVLKKARGAYHKRYVATLSAGFSHLGTVIRNQIRVLASNQGISLTETVVKELDTILVGWFLSLSAVGSYKMAKNFMGMAWRVADPISIVIMPHLAKYWSEGDKEGLKRFIKSLIPVALIVSPVIFGLSIVGLHVVVAVMLGPSFAESVRIYPLIACWTIIGLPLIWTYALASAIGRPDIFLKASTVGNVVGLLALIVGAWQFGLEGAAIGLSISYSLPFLLTFYFLRRDGFLRG